MPARRPLQRPHKKSRLGCQECKRRHIKCDEVRLICGNCLGDYQTCIYASPPPPTVYLLSKSAHASSYLIETPGDTSSVTPTLLPVSVGLTLHYFIFETIPCLDESSSFGREQACLMMPVALSTPYAVPETICLCNNAHSEVTVENCASMLIFSRFLSLHTLTDVAIAVRNDASGFLDLHFSLSSILNRAEYSLNPPYSLSQFDHLHALLDQADMGTESKLACQEAVSQLQLVYRSEKLPVEISEMSHSSGLFVTKAGQMLIEEITGFLGAFWKEWLEWPDNVLGQSVDDT
ncbi:hypothetical protein BS50DRAFT_603925 [Corynespora cassiicola Philippines]|uniref:Zn(2)-C6 fungal-type domain-containing protein n=1 Tax=Corynespora cassiicola Philippines TaxID=1448308 RepID=A0A2T2N8L2_CORCC|nr:hypothetical protein BS50DRAFT_603925 [Corynespora cassiicola Philippines]